MWTGCLAGQVQAQELSARLCGPALGAAALSGPRPSRLEHRLGQAVSAVGAAGPAGGVCTEAGMAAKGGRATCPPDEAARLLLGRHPGRRAAPCFPQGEQGRGNTAITGLPRLGCQGRAESGAQLASPCYGFASGRDQGTWGCDSHSDVCPVTAQPSPCRLGAATCFLGGTFCAQWRGPPRALSASSVPLPSSACVLLWSLVHRVCACMCLL